MISISKISARSAISGLMKWLRDEPEEKSSTQADLRTALNFAVLKTASGRWCWELTDERGQVHGRSTTDFAHEKQAVASAQFVQYLSMDAVIASMVPSGDFGLRPSRPSRVGTA